MFKNLIWISVYTALISFCIISIQNQGRKSSRKIAHSFDKGNFSLKSSKKIQAKYELSHYVQECQEALGPIPQIKCLEGQIIPITDINDIEITPSRYDNLAKSKDVVCKKPIMVQSRQDALFSRKNVSCLPGTRVGVHKERGQFNTDWAWTCRRYFNRSKISPYYDDINMIGYNIDSGKTCFFVSQINKKKPTINKDYGHHGAKIPALTDFKTHKFWKSPFQMDQASVLFGGTKDCIECHSSDPFVHSPAIHQLRDEEGKVLIPRYSSMKKPYQIVGSRYFNEWNKRIKHLKYVYPINEFNREVKKLEAADDIDELKVDLNVISDCLDCHKMGNFRYCSEFVGQAMGTQKTNGLDPLIRNRAWMPNSKSKNWKYHKTDDDMKSIAKIVEQCCSNNSITFKSKGDSYIKSGKYKCEWVDHK